MNLLITLKTKMNEIVILTKNLRSRALEVKSDLSDVGSKVVHAEGHVSRKA